MENKFWLIKKKPNSLLNLDETWIIENSKGDVLPFFKSKEDAIKFALFFGVKLNERII